MAFRTYYGLVGQLSGSIDDSTVLVPVNNAISGALVASGFINGTDSTYLAIVGGGKTEVVRVTDVDGTLLTVERGSGNTLPEAFPVGSILSFVLTVEGIQEALPTPADIVFTGQGVVGVQQEPTSVKIIVDEPTLEGNGGIEVIGGWPNYQIVYNQVEGNCCDCSGGGGGGGEGATGITELQGMGIANAYSSGNFGYIEVPAPSFNGSGITIEGEWPNLYFTVDSGSGSGVEIVGVGSGLVLTGSPTTNPTISMANTGVVAGTYGGITLNAKGQFTNVPATFDPISVLTAGTNVDLNRVGDNVTVTVVDAAVGVRGAVALADETDPFDPNDNTNAATPAVVAAAIDAIGGATLSGVSSFTAEVSTDYTNIIGATGTSVVLEAGQKALIMAEATILNSTTPLTPVDFGIAVFSSTAMLQGNKKMTQSSQQVTFVLNGPFNDTVILATTAVPAGSTVVSYGLAAVIF